MALILMVCILICSLVGCGDNKEDYISNNDIEGYQEYEYTEEPVDEQYYEKDYDYNENTQNHQHSFTDATCTAAGRCWCGATSGKALGHSYSGSNCVRCGAKNLMQRSNHIIFLLMNIA